MTETISIYAYVLGFQQFETSYTAAIALLIIVILSALVIWALKRVEMGLASRRLDQHGSQIDRGGHDDLGARPPGKAEGDPALVLTRELV